MITKLAEGIKFPLYKDDGKPLVGINQRQRKSIDQLNQKIKDGHYKLIDNPCLCGNKDPNRDTLIAKKDMYGVSIDNVLCQKCGLIRSHRVFDKASARNFYETEYKPIYYDVGGGSIDNYFSRQIKRGKLFYDLIDELKIMQDVSNVFEVGCGAGGVLFPFYEQGMAAGGCDFEADYIQFGTSKGLKLYEGELDHSATTDNSIDLMILSHVMEHFIDPIGSMTEIIGKVKPGKYLLVEVPGIFADVPTLPCYPIYYLQAAHVVNYFYRDFLEVFFRRLNMEILRATERCTFILRKPETYIETDVNNLEIYDDNLKDYSSRINDFLKSTHLKYHILPFPLKYKVKRSMASMLEILGLKDMLISKLR